MRPLKISLISGLILASLSTDASAATSLGRGYDFGFLNGNLVRNWSFENLADNWYDESMAAARYLAKKDNISAVSGSYVAKFSGTNSTGGMFNKFISETFPVESAVSYTLSFYVKTAGNTSGVHPVVWFYSDQSASLSSYLGPALGSSYPINADWILFTYSFSSPAGSSHARLALIEISPSQGGTFYFDDVLFEKGVPSATLRDFISESVQFSNDGGQVLQSQVKIAGGGNNASGRKYFVQATQVDALSRVDREYLPYMRSGNPDYDPAFAANAAAYNNGSNGKGSLGSRPYRKVEYTDELVAPVSATYMPGEAWSGLDTAAGKAMKSGSYFTSSLTAPSSPEAETTDDAERPYLYSWEKDVEGRYTLSWSNALGQVIQTAVKPASTWLYTRYEYFPNGKLKKILQDSDVPGDDSQQDFREVTNYNSAGEVTSTYSKDRGLRKYWYNRLGQLRFTRHESMASGQYEYTDFDNQDRPIAMGVQPVSSFGPATVEQRSTPAAGKVEHKGFIYDNLDQFQARTGLVLSNLLPGKTLGVNGQGRVVCEYNHNKEVALASPAPADKFVATFYNYDKYGKVSEAYKYIGPVKVASRRIHKVTYTYDSNHRLLQTLLEDNAANGSVQKYAYDALGRVSQVSGSGSRFYSSYQYYDWGGIKSVLLGGSGNASTGTRIDYTYHAQGWVKEIKAVRQATGEVVFQQFLGYEAKAVDHANVPALSQAKFDGSISQQLYKFANDVQSLNPIRAVNYQYDNLNRMVVADARKNAGSPPWDALQQIQFANLQWTDTEDLDSRLTYDANGRIASNRSGVAAGDLATYHYQGNSYKLDRVTGKLNSEVERDASPTGTFVYDSRGRMIEDKSKKMNIRYGWDDMPFEFAVDMGDSLVSDFNFYDAQGKRVSRVRVKTEKTVMVPIMLDGITFFVKGLRNTATLTAKEVSSITEVNLLAAGDRRWVEIYGENGQVEVQSARVGVFGISAQIGELAPNGSYRFFVKNHLGSTMRSVGDNGEFLDAEGNTLDYLAYGSQKKLKVGSTDQVTTFTGKELEELTRLYAFGARWYDPELAIWMLPDPARQYFNPYAYGPGPINGVDHDGLLFDPFTIAAVGALVVFGAVAICSHIDACSDFVGGVSEETGVSRVEAGSNGGINIEFMDVQTNPGLATQTPAQIEQDINNANYRGIENLNNAVYDPLSDESLDQYVHNAFEAEKARAKYMQAFPGHDPSKYRLTPEVSADIELLLDATVHHAIPGTLAAAGVVGGVYTGSVPGARLTLFPRGPQAEIKYTRSNLALGQKMHRNYRANEVLPDVRIKELRLPSGLRPDFVNFETKTIYELKPNNPRAIKQGLRQLAAYKAEMEKIYGPGWKTVLDTY